MGECACGVSDTTCEEVIEAEFSVCADCTTASECKESGKCKDGYSAEETTCGVGEELQDGKCVKVSVELPVKIELAEAVVSATTGKQVILISGIAFHEGVNKNGWEINLEGAQSIVQQMVGMDITLNHPTPDEFGFSRNMDGGVDEAVVGVITSASIEMTESGWNVRYTAEVRRPELFEALESGLWLRSDYGVSIGGTGMPDEVREDGSMLFGADFEFDHLAIVHRPAYERANIEDAVKVGVSDFSKREIEANRQSFKYQTQATPNHTQTVKAMTEEEIIEETATEEAVIATDESHDDLKAQLVLANARIAEMEAIEAAKLEEARMELVAKATELGLAGHEDLPSDTLTSLIASWEASRPEPSVEMKPIASTHSGSPTPEPTPEAVVSNFLNGERLHTPETQYAKYYNLWAKAWNSTVTSSDDRALTYEETKEMI